DSRFWLCQRLARNGPAQPGPGLVVVLIQFRRRNRPVVCGRDRRVRPGGITVAQRVGWTSGCVCRFDCGYHCRYILVRTTSLLFGRNLMKRVLALSTLLILAAISVWAAGQARGGAAQAPAGLGIEKVKDNLYQIIGEGGNSGMFVTDAGVVLIDTKNP